MHQSKDWFQEMLLSVLSDAVNHNPPLSSLRPLSLSFPPMFLSFSCSRSHFCEQWFQTKIEECQNVIADLGLPVALHRPTPFFFFFFLLMRSQTRKLRRTLLAPPTTMSMFYVEYSTCRWAAGRKSCPNHSQFIPQQRTTTLELP